MAYKVHIIANKPEYPRNKILIQGLGEIYDSINIHTSSKFKDRWHAFWEIVLENKCEAIIFLWPALSNLVLIFLLRIFTSKNIVYDAFTSFYDSAVNDRKKFKKASLKAARAWLAEFCALKLAQTIWFDTESHKNFFVENFYVNTKKRLSIIPVSVDVSQLEGMIQEPTIKDLKETFVLFYGTYIPLHGTEFIVQAAHLLSNKNIQFVMIGEGQSFSQVKRIYDEMRMKNIKFLNKVSYGELMWFIKKATLCLGIFGTTEKAQRVIPNKIIECTALNKCVISEKSPELERYFEDGVSILMVEPGNAAQLAEKILSTFANPVLMNKIGQNGNLVTRSMFGYTSLVSSLNESLCNSQESNSYPV